MCAQPVFDKLFLGAGAMKSGTTWLYAVLRRHPQLYFSLEKELHYFYHSMVRKGYLDDAERMKLVRAKYLGRVDSSKDKPDVIQNKLDWIAAYLDSPVDDAWYARLFEQRPKNSFACDFSNMSALLPARKWRELEAKTGQLKVLYTMRDPLKRMWSDVKFHIQVQGRQDELASWGPKDYRKYFARRSVWIHADYPRAIRQMQSGLSEGSWKAIFYEDIHADQRAMLREIEAFLGIEAFEYPDQVLNLRPTESVKLPMPEFFPEVFAGKVTKVKRDLAGLGFAPPESWG
jgi:hypothetical protein